MDTWTKTHKETQSQPHRLLDPWIYHRSQQQTPSQIPTQSHLNYYNYIVPETLSSRYRDKNPLPNFMSLPRTPNCLLWRDPIFPCSHSQILGQRKGCRGPAQAGGRLVSYQNQTWGRTRSSRLLLNEKQVEAGVGARSSFLWEVPALPQIPAPHHGAPTWHLNMVPIHVSRGVPEQAVGDEAVGVHAVDEWKGSLGGRWGREQGQAEPWPCSSPSPPATSTIPPLSRGPHHASL